MGENHNEVPGAPPTASEEQIRAAFSKLTFERHPARYVARPVCHLMMENFKRVATAFAGKTPPG